MYTRPSHIVTPQDIVTPYCPSQIIRQLGKAILDEKITAEDTKMDAH